MEDLVGAKLLEELSPSSLYDEKAAIILGEMMYRAKSEALVRLYQDTIEKIIDDNEIFEWKINELNNLLKKAASCRNGYAHGSWIDITRSGYVAVRSKSKNSGVIVRYIRYLKTDIENDIKLIRRTIKKLEEFDDMFYEATISMR